MHHGLDAQPRFITQQGFRKSRESTPDQASLVSLNSFFPSHSSGFFGQLPRNAAQYLFLVSTSQDTTLEQMAQIWKFGNL